MATDELNGNLGTPEKTDFPLPESVDYTPKGFFPPLIREYDCSNFCKYGGHVETESKGAKQGYKCSEGYHGCIVVELFKELEVYRRQIQKFEKHIQGLANRPFPVEYKLR